MEQISINFIGGSHGNFLSLLCQTAFCNLQANKIISGAVTYNGTYHNLDVKNKVFIPAHYFTMIMNPDPVEINGTSLEILNHIKSSMPALSKKIINISLDSTIEHALLLTYWRRAGDCFFMSPNELLHSTVSDVRIQFEESKIVNVQQPLGAKHREIIFNNALTLYEKYTTPNEIELIMFWCNHRQFKRTQYGLGMSAWQANNVWLAALPEENIVNFRMIWFYDEASCLAGIKLISDTFNLPLTASDEKMLQVISTFGNNIQEKPNINLVQEKYNDIISGNNSSLDTITLNDKIVLLQALRIYYKLLPVDFEELNLTSYPSTATEYREIIQAALAVKESYTSSNHI
jgi:hypothetical protein